MSHQCKWILVANCWLRRLFICIGGKWELYQNTTTPSINSDGRPLIRQPLSSSKLLLSWRHQFCIQIWWVGKIAAKTTMVFNLEAASFQTFSLGRVLIDYFFGVSIAFVHSDAIAANDCAVCVEMLSQAATAPKNHHLISMPLRWGFHRTHWGLRLHSRL